MQSSKEKCMGQYMTPDGIVNIILDTIGYVSDGSGNILKKTIMEPSFGDGAFLINLVMRIISEANRQGKTSSEIASILDSDVYGIELDQNLYNKAIKRLNNLLQAYNIPQIQWSHLLCDDTFKVYSQYANKFDYIVGNPPFVRVHNMQPEYRDIAKDFMFSDGMIDMYILFYEMGLQMLNDTGRLCYISSNSFMKNTSQKAFRDYLIKNKYIANLYDFKWSQLFPGITTYTCICALDKNKERVNFSIEYREYSMYDLITQTTFDYSYFESHFLDKSWNLGSEEDIHFYDENQRLPIKIDNIAVVQNGVATNKDTAYIRQMFCDQELHAPYMGKHTDKKTTIYFRAQDGEIYPIESTCLHRCVKASKYNGRMDNTYIIFPYKPVKIPKVYDSSNSPIEIGYEPYSEKEFSKKFPKAYHYLLTIWDDLSSRDMEKNAEWFVFGRSQGLQNSGLKKIVFKHVINKTTLSVTPYILDADVIVYSGIYTTINVNMCIAQKHDNTNKKNNGQYLLNSSLYDYELTELCQIFKSTDFAHYCAIVGKDMSGGYVGVSSNMIKQFGTRLSTFPTFPIEINPNDFNVADNNYLNNKFNEKFVTCIKTSHENMGEYGKTSSKRIEPFHSFLAEVLQYKLGSDYDVKAMGYSYGKEAKLGGNFNNKDVDVCVFHNGQPVGAIAFKLFANNFKQNLGNFIEGMLGEAIQMRTQKFPYAFCYLIPEKALYLKNSVTAHTQPLGKIEELDQDDLAKFYHIMLDESYKERTPDALFIGVHKLFKDDYLDQVKQGDLVDLSSAEYLSAICPEWSNYSFLSDEDMKQYFIRQNNIGAFLDEFINKILAK